MIKRTSIAFITLLLSAAACLHAQPTDTGDDSSADSLVANSQGLFDDSLLNATRPHLPASEDARLRALRPGDWSPVFPVEVRRHDLLGLQDTPPLLLSYDRADGLYLGLGTNTPARLLFERRLQGYFGFGYALGAHYWQVMGGFSADLGSRTAPVRIGGEGHIITDTRDAWKMDVDENSAFALLAGIDNRDYFQRSGFSAYVRKFLWPRVGIGVEYRMDKYRNSKREIGWSLFGPHQPFFEVPSILEGTMSSVAVKVAVDYMALRSWDATQFGFEAQAEFGSLDSSFQQYVADARMKTTIIHDYVWLAVHGRFAAATGNAPPQKLFTVGGLGTLPGYDQNGYLGNRMLLLQTDLLLAPFPRIGLRVILSNDFATIATATPETGLFSGFIGDITDVKYSPGIYLGSATGAFRIGYAFRTDIFKDPHFIMRIAQPF